MTASQKSRITQHVQHFYDQRPYPPPVKDLDDYRARWRDENQRRADYHLHWPDSPYRENLSVLVAGCGTSQAAKHALRNPAAWVVGIDLSATSIQHTEALKRQYQLDNLEVHQLPVEQAGALDRRFDKVICTGVLHHLPDPEVGLRVLREVLSPEGALDLMVYAPHGRYGVYMLQEYARLVGVGLSDAEINDLANTLMALPQEHPLAPLLGGSPDFRTRAGLADALLNPQDRAYTVPQLFALLDQAGLRFGRWLRQASYLPQCGAFAETPHVSRLAGLDPAAQYTAMELLRGTMLRHSLIAYRDDGFQNRMPSFDGDTWRDYVPIRLPETVCVEEQLPPGAAGVLINQNHTDRDIYLPIGEGEKRMYTALGGGLSLAEIAEVVSIAPKSVRAFFERLWWYDQVLFAISAANLDSKDFRSSP